MTFYQELQLSSTGSKQLIKNTTDKKEKRRHILIYNFKARPRPPSTLAAHRGYHLPLLPSGPGGVHEFLLRKTRPAVVRP